MASTARRKGSSNRKRGSYAPDVTRQALLDGALQLFSERGFHATSVQAIVQRAGVTKGAFYHHFESKEDILRQIHGAYAGEMAIGAREIAARIDIGPAEKLRAIIIRAVIALGRHREHVAVFYQENRFLSGDEYTAIRDLHDEQEKILLEIIAQGQRTGEIRPEIDPKLLMFSISGITAWIYQWYQPDGSLPLETIAETLATIILEPIAITPGSTRAGAPRSGGALAA